MRTRIRTTLLVLCTLAIACSKDDDLPADPRLAFAGNYESQEHVAGAAVEGDDLTTKIIPADINVSVQLAQGNQDALEMDLKELVEAVLAAYVTESFSVDFDGPVIAVINDHSFQLKTTEFLIESNGITPATLNGEGAFDGNTLHLEYEFSAESEGITLIFKSIDEIELQKDDSNGTKGQQ